MDDKKILVMGVSGCGKSLIGSALAEALGFQFFDGDDYHPKENVEKMRNGIPLLDEDRIGWLKTLNLILNMENEVVIACSALKPQYRDILRDGNENLTVVYLQGEFETIWRRYQKRNDHFFNGYEMLKSQFATLVEPSVEEDALFIDISCSPEKILENILKKLNEN
ncbi:gluconokinase [Parasalinivibrio latis]|uniref:gluconokinase n=1 Tax=Parasalinivibrio latis TaxID=2952610 RepID=UPI0030E5B68E